jgi:hypothetical protein
MQKEFNDKKIRLRRKKLPNVPKLDLPNPMRDRTITRLGHLRPKKIFQLCGRRAGVVLAPKTSPIRNQDRDAYARGIARAQVAQE